MGFFLSNRNDNVSPIETEKKELKKLYCIDFENTQDSGIIGISKLNPRDDVVIFYGSNNNSISFVSHEMIVLANCNVIIMKCDRSAKNYLDFQLVSYIGKRLGKEKFEEVVIVSKDTGYDSVVDFWKKEEVNIKRQAAIDPAVKMETANTNDKSKKAEKAIKNNKKNASNNEESKSNKKEAAPINVKQTSGETKKKTNKPDDTKANTNNNNKEKKDNKVVSLPDSYKKKIRNAVKDVELKPTQYTLIYTSIQKSKTNEEYERVIKKRIPDKADIIIERTSSVVIDYLDKTMKENLQK